MPDVRLSGMDSGWAVVLGAVITLVGVVMTPWAREAAEGRARRNEAQRDAFRAHFPDFVRATSALALGGFESPEFDAAGVEASTKLSELALLLRREDRPIEIILVLTRALSWTPKGRQVISTMQRTVHAWFRGSISAKHALRDFQDAVARIEK
jgi:ABC-type transport system involved in cytochrome bd biosynthesis fused ATPase/permease subunit